LNANHRVDLTGLARGKAESKCAHRVNAAGAEMPAWCCLWRVAFISGWPGRMVKNVLPQDVSLLTARRQNLLVSWRRDAELAIAKTPATAGAKSSVCAGSM